MNDGKQAISIDRFQKRLFDALSREFSAIRDEFGPQDFRVVLTADENPHSVKVEIHESDDCRDCCEGSA